MTTRTGFDGTRADFHDRVAVRLVGWFNNRGYPAMENGLDGHHPDLTILDANDRDALVDIKTGGPNIMVELDSFAVYLRLTLEGHRVYIVHVPGPGTPLERISVNDVPSLMARFDMGPERANGNGSKDDWYRFKAGGTPLESFFPQRMRASI